MVSRYIWSCFGSAGRGYRFALGEEKGHLVQYWVADGFLCVDLHDKSAKSRIARKFPLGIVPSTPATLFGGFENTKHADVKVATKNDTSVEDWHITEVDYENCGVAQMSGREFWKIAKFSKK